jgi:hypothetical protein
MTENSLISYLVSQHMMESVAQLIHYNTENMF